LSAKQVEGRGLAKGNPSQPNALQTPSRDGLQSALDRIRRAARKDRKMRFTALLHHVYHPNTLQDAYCRGQHETVVAEDGLAGLR
jgi:hypothetical protein